MAFNTTQLIYIFLNKKKTYFNFVISCCLQCKDFEKVGATLAVTPCDVVEAADITFSCVADPQAAKEVTASQHYLFIILSGGGQTGSSSNCNTGIYSNPFRLEADTETVQEKVDRWWWWWLSCFWIKILEVETHSLQQLQAFAIIYSQRTTSHSLCDVLRFL